MYKEVIRFLMTSDRKKQFTRVMTSLFRAQRSVVDLFFNNRLEKMTEQLLESYQQASHSNIKIMKNTIAQLEEISYLKQGELVPLAVAQEQLLRYMLDIIREVRAKDEKLGAQPAPEISPLQVPVAKKEIASGSKTSRKKDINQTASRQKILEFVKSLPERRAKEIIVEFSALSERTVKRGLKELSKEGLIIKKFENGTVYYSAV